MNPNLLDKSVRRAIVQEIKAEENISRKREHQKRFDVYRERQDIYILERLGREFSQETLKYMRKILSINLSQRIIDEMSSVYSNPPTRTFSAPNRELSEAELEQCEELYEHCDVNKYMRMSNRWYNLHDQTALMVMPNSYGGIKVRGLTPNQYDVIPDSDDAEMPYAYILNVWDYDLNKTANGEQSEQTQLSQYRMQDNQNQAIADDDDRKAMLDKYKVWTKDFYFTMNGVGELLTEVFPNPIGQLPFIDIAKEKDFQFFVRRGTSVVDFSLDFGLMLSDLANIIRLQGYSQAVMASEKKPVDVQIGPQKVLWLQIDPNRPEAKPSFEFVTPSPDLGGSLEFLEMNLRMFLSSRGIDPSTISGKGEAKSFSSGIERLLSMLQKFEATRSDFDLFQGVEYKLFDLLRAWSNIYQDVIGPGELDEELRQSVIGDDVEMEIKFGEPAAVQTQMEKEDSIIKLLDAGLMSREEAIQELRGVSPEKASEVLVEIDKVVSIGGPQGAAPVPVKPVGDETAS